MRKYLAILVAVVVAFALTAIAQTYGGTQPNTGTSQSNAGRQDQGNTAGQNTSGTYSTSPSQESNTRSSAGTEESSATSKKVKEHALKGCVIREETDYFLVPKHGNPVRLGASGTTNLSEHVGHEVTVHGKYARPNANVPTGGYSGTETGEATTPSTKAEPAGSGGAVAGNPNAQESAEGTATATGPVHKAARNEELVVDRLDMISESCPAHWNKKWSSETGGNSAAPSQK